LRVAVCTGSFDPVTCGHIDIFERTSPLFDRVVISIFENPNKAPLFSTEEKMAMIKASTVHLKNVEVDSFQGLLSDYMRRNKYSVVVRGLRAFSDFEYEFQRALFLKQIAPELETMFMMTNSRMSFVSSSGVKELATFGGDITGMVPPEIVGQVLERIRRK
jgi:pantetheine-phosphate adenylyltransferase, bacterial